MKDWLFFDRDISWLSFNERVLQEAANKSVPLLERFKFLSIYSSNLDEFYRVRIPAIIALQKINKDGSAINIYRQAVEMINRQLAQFGHILNTILIPELKQTGYFLLNNEDIPESLEQTCSHYFYTQIAGLLQPVRLTPEADFFPENNQLYLAAIVHNDNGDDEIYLVNIPCNTTPRFLNIVKPEGTYILFIEDIISRNLCHVFGGKVINAYNIKITRDAELDLESEYEEDLAEKIEKQLMKREMGLATRFLYQPDIPFRHLQTIIKKFNLQNASVIEGGRHHNLKDLATLPIKGEAFSYPLWLPAGYIAYDNAGSRLFDKIGESDQMIHAPYQSFDAVLRFFNEASIDITVEEIYTTLYRVAHDSKIALALISAARNGKRVTVLVELKARFDEANNIRWAKKMKSAGVRIVYSANKLKVHAKVALIKRKHPVKPLLGLMATGNFNENTACFYTDHILFTARQDLLSELGLLFTFLRKRKNPAKEDAIPFQHLLVSQFNLQSTFIGLIDREMVNAGKGLPASIMIKLNNLEEDVLISKLYDASNAGVKVELIVRSICRLVPGVPMQSENITVKRIVDRYLEHGRVFIFHNNGNPEVYMGSCDWMNRNIYRRIEVCFPVYDEGIKQELMQIISLQSRDNMKGVWIDKEIRNVSVEINGDGIRSQEAIYTLLKGKQ